MSANTNTAAVTIIAEGTEVEFTRADGETALGTVTGYAKGWYAIELEDGEQVKARAAQLEVVKSDEEEEESDEEGEDGELTPGRKMAQTLREARVGYARTRRPDGTPSADCADVIAKELRDLGPLEVAALADRCLKVPKGTHEAKYGHMNNGQIRMNSGNRIRAALKAAEKEGDEKTIKHILFVLGLDQ